MIDEKKNTGIFHKIIEKTTGLLKNNYFLTSLLIFICTVFWFSVSYCFLYQNNGFFNGDKAMFGLILKDLRAGRFYSWYFYGQIYYGNLSYFASLPLTFIFGVSRKALVFYDFLFYGLSVFFGLASFKFISNFKLLVPLFTFILFFYGRHLEFSYSIQGFSIVLFIITLMFFWFKKIIRKEYKIDWKILFFTPMISALGIWHNPLYSFVGPVLLLILTYLRFKPRIKHFLQFIAGFMIGIIPFVMGTVEKNYVNWSFFGANKTLSYYESGNYFLRDWFFFPFSNTYLVPGRLGEYFKNLINTQTPSVFAIFTDALPWISISFISIFVILIGVLMVKRETSLLINYVFISLIAFLIISKNSDQSMVVFANIRYALPFFFLVILTTLELFTIAFKNPNPNFINPAVKYLTLILVVFFVMNSMVRLNYQYKVPDKGIHFNELAYLDIEKLGIKNLFCWNYYEMCAPLAYLGYEYGLNVYVLENAGRNPRGEKNAIKARENGEDLYTIMPENMVPKDKGIVILGQYRMLPTTPNYVLYKGFFG